MNCPVTMSLSAYVLGGADAREQLLVGDHISGCPACSEELARLAPIPGLLARLPPAMVPGPVPPSPAAGPRGLTRLLPGRAWRAMALTAAALAVGLGAGFSLAASGTSPPAAPGASAAAAHGITFSGDNPAAHVRATAVLTATSWGTRIELQLSGAPLNNQCSLIVITRAGASEQAGIWSAWSNGPINVPASASWHLHDITKLTIVSGARTLATLTARRSAPDRQAAN
jgi:Putative zinc-finger